MIIPYPPESEMFEPLSLPRDFVPTLMMTLSSAGRLITAAITRRLHSSTRADPFAICMPSLNT